MQAPCMGCKKRELNCHSKCQEYLEYKAERNRISDLRKRDSELTGFIIEHRARTKKRREHR